VPGKNRPNLKLLLPLAALITGLFALPIASLAQTALPPTANPPVFLGVRTVVNTQGTQIVEIIPDSPAAKGGLLVGDTIIGIDGIALSGDYTIDTALTKHKPGDQTLFTVKRGDQTVGVTIVLTSPPSVLPTANLPTLTPGGPTTIPQIPYIGIGLQEQTVGLLVVGILQGGPSDQAGLRVGDTLLSLDNQTLSTVTQAETIIQGHKPGDTLAAKVKRGDQTLDIKIVVALRPVLIDGTPIKVLTPATTAAGTPVVTGTPAAQSDTGDLPTGPRVRLGVTYRSVTPNIAADRKLSVDHGALVISVTSGSPADAAGIKVGDVITAVEGDKVDTKRTLAIRMIPYVEGDTVSLTVVRGDQTLTITVTLVNTGSA
jgi:S1-C subfamily serine protease